MVGAPESPDQRSGDDDFHQLVDRDPCGGEPGAALVADYQLAVFDMNGEGLDAGDGTRVQALLAPDHLPVQTHAVAGAEIGDRRR